jgi:hypothetical protein
MTNKKRKPAKSPQPPRSATAKTDSVTADVYSKKTMVEQKEYKTVEVKGRLHELGRLDDHESVLYIAANPSQIEMACIMSEGSKYNSYIYNDGYDFYDLSLDYRRPSFISSIKGVAAILKRVTKIVTYIGQINSNVRKEYRTLLSTALRLEIPIIEMPHGLIQSGYNLDDDSRFIDLSSYYDGIGRSLPSIASMRLAWYGDNSVGYPRHNALKNFKDKVVPNYTLITTNTNWFLYSVEDKRNFFNLLFRFAELNPNKLFIWSPHPAETNEQTYSSHVVPLRPANVLTYGLTKDIYFDGIEGSNDLIAYCQDGITTVSTCLLEYEIHKKPVQVFSTEGVSEILSSLASVKTFSSAKDLLVEPEIVATGMLQDYDPEKFDKFLKWAPKSDPRDSLYLDMV